MKKMQGFTLIEIMIALLIIGILAGIAIPNYSDYVLKAKRSDAHTALANMASAQEDYYANNQYVYTDVVANVGGPNSQEGYYILSITMPASAD
ncbi:MAG: prepilin-type N-terminal cleavage/methylation domain-containing protein, partial [Gammaproteobacteria bacterium]|nr:prepilin-type N-terminal cleavage/methylation domain-containing protein [Gammaproteobacteria bacterium]